MHGVAAAAVALGLVAGSAPLAVAPSPSVSPSASAPASPSPSRAGLFVRVTPDTVQADYLVGIDASCGDDNRQPARVESAAFGPVTVRPQNGLLTAAARVPADRGAGTYRVHLTCRNGRTATTILRVVARTRPSRGPATGFGGTAGGDPWPAVLISGGTLAIVAGAGLGLLALRRRAPGPPATGGRRSLL
ncbi:MAG: hypothetical protein IRZ05_21380 [Micromonosporaceae bacterium]|nr:hypothetical protein [Micromonosporaceae bacterium]